MKLGLLRDQPWLEYITGFVGGSTLTNLLLSLLLVRYIIDGNVIRHRRLFSAFDVAHSMLALVTGFTMVFARFIVSGKKISPLHLFA